jgi:MFS family permease
MTQLHTKGWYRTAVNAFYFIQGLVFASWACRIPEIKELLGMNDAELGGVLFFLPLGEICTMIPAGYLVSKYGSRKMLTLGALCYPMMLVGIGLATSTLQLSVVLFLFGMAGNLSNISVNTQAIGVERLYGRSIMGSFHGLWSLAGFTGGLIGMLMVALNMSPLFHYLIIFVLMITVMLFMRGSTLPRDGQLKRLEENQRKIFTRPDRYILIIGLMALGSAICEGTVFDWTNIYFDEVLLVPKNLVRFGYVAAMGSMTIGRFTVDRFITRFGFIRVLRFCSVMIIVGLAFAVGIPHLITSTLGFLLIGAGMSSVIPICYSLAGRAKNMLPGIAITTVSSIGFLGLLAGPPFIGFVSHAIGLRWALCVIAIVGVIILWLTPALRKLLDIQKK